MPLRVMHIAEIGLRVINLANMVSFYKDTLGFEIHIAGAEHVFLRIGDLNSPLGKVGHPQLLALFKRQPDPDINFTSLDHLAFEIPDDQYEAELAQFKAAGMVIRERSWPDSLDWRARSFFFRDPEGNIIELVSSHSS